VRLAGVCRSGVVSGVLLRLDASEDASCCASAVESSREGDVSRARLAAGVVVAVA
jgi:hypothetical protein